jgi:hypothetical protein
VSGPTTDDRRPTPLRYEGRRTTDRFIRLSLASVGGNLLGYAAWRVALAVIPRLWEGRSAGSHPLVLMGLVAVSFVLLAAPPVLIGALTGWAARRWHIWVGLASGLWAVSLIGRVPADFPLAAGLWYAPTVLVLLSGALGGWSASGLKGEG